MHKKSQPKHRARGDNKENSRICSTASGSRPINTSVNHASLSKKSMPKQDSEVRKNLIATLNLLKNYAQSNPAISSLPLKVLSREIYKITRERLERKDSRNNNNSGIRNVVCAQLEQNHGKISQLQSCMKAPQANFELSQCVNATQSQYIVPEMEESRQNDHRKSNSTLEQYFSDKFGSPAKNEGEIEKKLKVLKALKKSQDIAQKYRSQTLLKKSENNWSQPQTSEKHKLMDKLKNRKGIRG